MRPNDRRAGKGNDQGGQNDPVDRDCAVFGPEK